MILPVDINATWEILERAALQPGEVRVREMDEIKSAAGNALFALDQEHHRHLLIPIAASLRVHEDTGSAGVHITAHQLLDESERRRFLDIECRKPHLNNLFSIIASEMISQLSEDESRPDLVCHQVLSRWRELLEESSNKPDLQAVVGLFGELWQLREIVQRNSRAVNHWVGPTGARHDLTCGQVSLEVKSSLRRQGRFFTVHGHDQLEPPQGGELYVAAVKLEQVLKGGGETLSELISAIASTGCDQHFLWTGLTSLGFTPEIVAGYNDIRFTILENRIYKIADEFPRIVSDSFKNGHVPNGVIAMNYQIDLSSEPPFPLADSEVAAVYGLLAT